MMLLETCGGGGPKIAWLYNVCVLNEKDASRYESRCTMYVFTATPKSVAKHAKLRLIGIALISAPHAGHSILEPLTIP